MSLEGFAAQGPLPAQAILISGPMYWSTFYRVLTGTGSGAGLLTQNLGTSSLTRARPYRARGFGRRWNSKPTQPVPMAVDIKRVPIRQFAPRDIIDYDATEPITGG